MTTEAFDVFLAAYERWDAKPGDADWTRAMIDAAEDYAAEVGTTATVLLQQIQAARREAPGSPPGPIVRTVHEALQTGGATP